jgi:hypothetical protein
VLGDTGPIKALWAHTDEVSIFGGLGGLEQGWKLVGPRLDWASSQVSATDSHFERDCLVERVDGGFAYTVDIERTTSGAERKVISTRRVTQIYRFLDGCWRIVHRHADLVRQGPPPGAAGLPREP